MNYQQTQREHAPITFDPADFAGMCRIMDTHGDSTVPFFCRNENGEDTCLSVCHDKITVKAHLERETARTGRKLTQRDFVLGLIDAALDEAERQAGVEPCEGDALEAEAQSPETA